MKIEYIPGPTATNPGALIICTGDYITDHLLDDIDPEHSVDVQIAKALRAPGARAIPRNNMLTTVRFRIYRPLKNASRGEMALFDQTPGALVNQVAGAKLRFTSMIGGLGGVRFLKDVTITKMKPTHIGSASLISYEATGGGPFSTT